MGLRAQRRPSGRRHEPTRRWRALGVILVMALLGTMLTTLPILQRSADAATTGMTLQSSVVPNGDITTTGWTKSGGANYYSNVDEPADSPTDSDYINGPQATNTNNAITFDLVNMPSDLQNLQAVQVRARHGTVGLVDDTESISYQILDSSNNALTAATPATTLSNTLHTDRYELNPSTSNTDTSTWNGARIRATVTWTQGGGSNDTVTPKITALDVNVIYSPWDYPQLQLNGYIFENDDEDQASGDAIDDDTQMAAGNTAITSVKKGERLNLRIQMENWYAAVNGARRLALFYDRGDGYWTKVKNSGAAVTGTPSSACADTNFQCTTVDGTSTNDGAYNSMAMDNAGNPWISYFDITNSSLRVTHYVGSGGSGCATGITDWSCAVVDSSVGTVATGTVSSQRPAIGLDANGAPWIAYFNTTNSDLMVARYLPGTAASGTCSANWQCTGVEVQNTTGLYPNLAFDQAGTPWVTYYNSSAGSLRVAKYIGSGGATCNTGGSAAWNCMTADVNGDSGARTSIAFSQNGGMWMAEKENAGNTLRVVKWVGSSGTGCGSGVTLFTCTGVITSSMTASQTEIAITPEGYPWVAVNNDNSGSPVLTVAKYVGGTSGTGCAVTSWTCTVIENSGKGKMPSIAMGPDGGAAISYYDSSNGDLKLARYVQWGGTGCKSGVTDWTCTTIDSTGDVGFDSSITFAPDGNMWISFYDTTNTNLKVAKLYRGGEITASASVASKIGDATSESHADMTSATNTANRDDADCIGGGTYSAGRATTSGEVVGLSMPAYSSSAPCTELSYTIDTSQATPSTSYRFIVATDDSARSDRDMWRGPVYVDNYPTLTLEAATTTRFSKDTSWSPAACSDTAWGCALTDTTQDTGVTSAIAFDTEGTAWTSYRSTTAPGKLYAAKYIGSGGSTCGSGITAWNCTLIDSIGDTGYSSTIAVDNKGNPWITYYQNGSPQQLKVAEYVGSGGTGCPDSTAWRCSTIDIGANVGAVQSLVFDQSGMPLVAFRGSSGAVNAITLARYVVSGGTGCSDAAWSCEVLDDHTPNAGVSLALDKNEQPVVAWSDGTADDLRVARFVGSGGSGCSNARWTCTNVDTSGSVGANPSLAIDAAGTNWVSYYDTTNTNLKVAKYSGGSWTTSTVDSTNDQGASTALALDAQGIPWIAYKDSTNNTFKVARYMGGATTGTCSLNTWSCSTVDANWGSGYNPAIAFDASGIPWVSSYFLWTGLKVYKMNSAPTPLGYAQSASKQRGNAPTGGDLRYSVDFGKTPRTESGTCSATSTNEGYCGASTNADSNYDSMTALSTESATAAFAQRTASNASYPSYQWIGQSTVNTTSSSIILQVWRGGTTNAWVTLATNSSNAANSNIVMTGTASTGTISDYWTADGANYWAYYRVVAASGSALTLKTDYFGAVLDQPPVASATLFQKDSGNNLIFTGNWVNTSTMNFGMNTVTDGDASDTLYLCVERQPIATAFTNIDTACGSGVAYSGSSINLTDTGVSQTDGTQYHWQARVKDSFGAYSSWGSFGGNGEGASDYGIDTTAPTAAAVYDGSGVGVDATYNTGSVTQLSANWATFTDTSSGTASGIASYSYQIGTTVGGADIKSLTSVSTSTSVTATGLLLKTSQMYYVRVYAYDNAGNSVYADSNGQMVPPTLTMSVTPSTINFAHLSTTNNYTDSQTATVSVATNGYGGYVVNMYGQSLLTAGSITIPAFTAGTWTTPATWSGTGFGYTSSDTSVQGSNRFGSGTKYAGVPVGSSNRQIVADESNGSTGTSLSSSYTITYKTVANGQPAGFYTSMLVFGATATF